MATEKTSASTRVGVPARLDAAQPASLRGKRSQPGFDETTIRSTAPGDAGPPPTDLDPTTDVAFIVGPARSGTSVLYKAICLHPETAWISNWVARFPRAHRLAALDRVARALPSWQRRVWFGDDSNAYVYGESRRPLAHRMFPMPVEGEPVYAASGVERPGIGDLRASRDAHLRLARAFRSIRAANGGSVLVSKRIANNLRIPFLARAFPRARFVEVVRDGRAVAASLARVDWWPQSHVWWYGGTPAAWEAAGGDPWEICARNWLEELRALDEGLAQVPPEQVMRLRYEELIADPVATLHRVAAFAGLPESSRWRTSLEMLEFPNRNDAWRERLADDVIARITSIQREGLERHGYR